MKKGSNFQPESYSLTRLNEVMKKRSEFKRCAGRNKWIFEELKNYLLYSKPRPWMKKEGEFIVGEVWEQYLGTVYHKHTKHVYTCLYVASEGLAVSKHGHTEVFTNGTVKKTKEFYLFSDGKIEFCGKDMSHELTNYSDKPIYVISVKVTGRGHKKNG